MHLRILIFFIIILLNLAWYALAGNVTKPNNFTSGTTISASEVNDDFDTLYTEINAKETRISAIEANSWVTAARINTAAVTTAKIDDGAVTAAKIADGAVTSSKLAGFTTVYSVDFSAQSSQDFRAGGDGSYTIDGKVWTVTNTSSATQFDIQNGTGLNIVSGGYLTIKLSTLYSSLKMYEDDILVWTYATVASVPTAARWYIVGVINYPTANALFAGIGHRNEGGTQCMANYVNTSGGTLIAPSGSCPTTNISDDVFVHRIMPDGRITMYSGVYSSGWPSFSSLRQRLTYNYFGSNPYLTVSPTDLGLYIGSDSSASSVLKQLRIQTK